MTEFIFLLLLLVALICFIDLRAGMYLTLVAGFLQDPLRKIVPDSPVYYSVVVILLAAATYVGAAQTGKIRPFRTIPEWSARLQVPIAFFVLIVVAQSIAAFFYTGSIVLTGIGMLVYLAPFPALLLAYSFASSARRLQGFFWLYVAMSATMASGVYLSWLGMDWEILRSVGEPLVVYSLETGEPLELPSGFLRSPEVAAWHAASGACVVLMLGLSERRKDTGLISVALLMFFIGAVMLTGRRKFLLEIAMYLPVLWWLLWRFKMATGRILYLLFVLALASAVVVVTGVVESDTREAFQAPVARGQDRTSEILDRFLGLTVYAFPGIVESNGFLGAGAGTGSGGAQYYGGGDDVVGLSAEGGLGKILAELGVPGFLLFFWLAFRFAVQAWRALAVAAKAPPESGNVAMGIAAFLAANATVFTNAHQVYSDPFILLIIGSCLGFILASHRFAVRGQVPAGSAMQPESRARARGYHP